MAIAMVTASFLWSLASASCCTTELIEQFCSEETRNTGGAMTLVVGDAEGACCTLEADLDDSTELLMYSASKWLASYTLLRMIDAEMMTLNTKVADVLDWWTDAKVTVKHLLSQTDGLPTFEGGLGRCPEQDTLGCAKTALSLLDTEMVGNKFTYSETSFYVIAEVAKKQAGLATWNDVFRKYLGDPLGMSPACTFEEGVLPGQDPGGDVRCSSEDYAKFLRAVLKADFVSDHLMKEAELGQTIGMDRDGGFPEDWDYGLGSWVLPPDATFGTFSGTCIHSQGIAGTFPWVVRDEEPFFGLLARVDDAIYRNDVMTPAMNTWQVLLEVVPLVRVAVAAKSSQESAKMSCPAKDKGAKDKGGEGTRGSVSSQAADVSSFFAATVEIMAVVLLATEHVF